MEIIKNNKLSESDEKECPICLDKYTGNSIRALRKKITCLKCSFSACKTCLKQVLLTTSQLPHCHKCKTMWKRQFLVDNFKKLG